ncbi:hypothetical protein SM124_19920 [Bacillus sp. 31A1R]|uniref:Uncharacterized protein n=1 Tax=Robertmurraya mangrovi TaxID=3098077 RepID=A0ABU5J3S8_9BACI|nr:hypothetical protein [Bacillus sp. 31A1R]MDZ5473992.1 hypothetical protein [Bacillus sp. 31A1R]
MNITTIIELDNKEVEKMADAKMVFAHEQINEQIVQTCVEGFQLANGDKIETDDALQKVFDQLKKDGIVPEEIEDFSYEMPSCERIKKEVYSENDLPQNVVISFIS